MSLSEHGKGEARQFLWASRLLRAGIFLHAVALFSIVFTLRQTQFGNLLFLGWLSGFEDPHIAALMVERITVSLYLAAGVLILFKPWWPVLLFMAGYAFLEAAAAMHNAGARFSDWSLASQALRYTLPLVLCVLVVGMPTKRLRKISVPTAAFLLRMAIASVFISHGHQAWVESPGFIDLLLGTSRRVLGIPLGEETAVSLLKIIAVVDYCVALMALIYPRPILIPKRWWASPCRICPVRRVIVPALMIWLSLWGGVTAFSRITALGFPGGWSQYPELIVRASHYLGPLALWCLFSLLYEPVKNGLVPKKENAPDV